MNRHPDATTVRFGRPPRRALTMVEILVVISVMGVLMGTVATVVSRTLRAEARTQNHVSDIRAAWQLADQFRADVRGARRVVVPNDANGNRLRVEAANAQVIDYSSDGRRILRTVADSSATPSRNDYYHLPDGVTAAFACFSSSERSFAQLSLTGAGTAPLPFVAEVGRDHRFASESNTKP